MGTSSTQSNEKWMTIEELASASEMTVRNIRAHLSRGTLPKPRIRGRKGYYDSDHLGRLKQITAMQDRGYSIAAIRDLLGDVDPKNVEVRVLEALNGWKTDAPQKMSLEEFQGRYGFLFKENELLPKVKEAGLIYFHDDQVEIPMPALAEVALSLHQHNADHALMPFIELAKRTKENLQSVAKDVVGTFIKDVMVENKDIDVSEIVANFRPLGLATVSTLFSHAIEKEITALLKTSADIVEVE